MLTLGLEASQIAKKSLRLTTFKIFRKRNLREGRSLSFSAAWTAFLKFEILKSRQPRTRSRRAWSHRWHALRSLLLIKTRKEGPLLSTGQPLRNSTKLLLEEPISGRNSWPWFKMKSEKQTKRNTWKSSTRCLWNRIRRAPSQSDRELTSEWKTSQLKAEHLIFTTNTVKSSVARHSSQNSYLNLIAMFFSKRMLQTGQAEKLWPRGRKCSWKRSLSQFKTICNLE